MHSDQTRKDGSSESMIQALYYDFVANYVKTRMYSTRYVQCNSGGQSGVARCNSLDDKIKLNGMHRSIVHIL